MDQDDTPEPLHEEDHPDTVSENTPQASDTQSDEDKIIDDKATDDAVDEIVEHESDEVLDAEDSAREEANDEFDDEPSNFWSTAGLILGLPFQTSLGRWLTFFMIVIAATIVGWIPTSRYWILNTAGVRASTQITVDDAATQLPLANVRVAIAGQVAYTNIKGEVNVTKLRLGPEVVAISRPGFATFTQPVTIGWGDNPLNSFALNAVGAHFTIQVRDFATGKPIGGALATSGDASALSDESGNISLVLDSSSGLTAPVTVTMDGYNTLTVTLNTNSTKAIAANLVSSQQVVYVAQTNGVYDLYKDYADGSNPTVLLSASGNESGTGMALATSPDDSYAAFISIRDTQHDSGGNPYQTLSLVNISSGAVVSLAHAGHIQLLGWVSNRLIFEQISDDSGTVTYSIISYDYATNSRAQLVSVPKLNVALTVQGMVYYAVASGSSGSVQPGFYAVNPDGSGSKTIYNQEVLGVLRNAYSTLLLQTDNGWQSYIVGSTTMPTGNPASFVNPQYVDSPDGTQSLWVSQGALLDLTVSSGKNTTVQTPTSVGYPVQWLSNDAIVYRVTDVSGTSEYIGGVSGVSHKVANVVNTEGFTIGG